MASAGGATQILESRLVLFALPTLLHSAHALPPVPVFIPARLYIGSRIEVFSVIRSLVTLGWLRDLALVLLACAGNGLRHTSPRIGFAILAASVVIFAERFLWSWHLCDLRDKHAQSSRPL